MNYKVVRDGLNSTIVRTDEPEGVSVFVSMNAARLHLLLYLKNERDSIDDVRTKYVKLIRSVKQMRVYDLE